jgi:hypothetical protein
LADAAEEGSDYVDTDGFGGWCVEEGGSMSRRPGDLIVKDPSADEPQGLDWTAWLAELGAEVEIGTSTWTITGPDAVLTKHDDSIVTGGHKTQVYLAAGTADVQYTVTNHVVTNSAPAVTDERSFYVLVQNR